MAADGVFAFRTASICVATVLAEMLLPNNATVPRPQMMPIILSEGLMIAPFHNVQVLTCSCLSINSCSPCHIHAACAIVSPDA